MSASYIGTIMEQMGVSTRAVRRNLPINKHMVIRSTLLQDIEEACSQDRKEADFALNLDICEVVKTKIPNSRIAVDHIVKIINGSDEHRCHLALCLLDLLVINCGYPMHVAISRREFLNKLVYRFPISPNHEPLDRCHHVILSLIQKWTAALCEKSKHKGDFGNVRLMYSLLRAKGFPMPDIREAEADAIVALESQSFRTKEDLEKEERLVLETKLNECIERGTPTDLQHANELMKRIVGYDSQETGKMAYSTSEAQIEHELNSLADKVSLLKSTDGPQRQELLRACKEAIPRLFQLANSDLSEPLMQKLLKLNEALHDVVINTESSLKTSPSEGHIHMGMLIDFEKKDDERSSTVVSPKLTTTQDIMDLFNQPKPMKPSQRPKIDVYFGSSFVLVDIVTLCNEEKFMRLFNTSSAPIGGLTIGLSLSPQQIKQRETLTIPYTGEIPVMIEICYTHLNEKHKETLKLSL